MYSVDNIENLTPQVIKRFIDHFEVCEKPKMLKWERYYKGKQDINQKIVGDTNQPNNKICENFTSYITNTYAGMLTGKPISYTADADIEDVMDVLRYNDFHAEDTELLRKALIYGVAYEICYIDDDGKQRFTTLNSTECIPVYDNTIEQKLLAVIRFYSILDSLGNTKKYIEVYDNENISVYHDDIAISLIEVKPHFYHQVPITVFTLNPDQTAIFDGIMSLQDAYNTLLSCNIDDFQAFTDAYLVLKNCIADSEDLQKMKENRVILLDADASAEYLTKNINNTNVETLLTRISDSIYSKSNTPDFNSEKFFASSGIALRLKLSGFIFVCSTIEAQMRKALQKRVELITEVLALFDSELVWRDIQITFIPNLPIDYAEIGQEINMLNGIVSRETLLSQIPFITDPKAELERLKEEKKESVNIYDFVSPEEIVEGA